MVGGQLSVWIGSQCVSYPVPAHEKFLGATKAPFFWLNWSTVLVLSRFEWLVVGYCLNWVYGFILILLSLLTKFVNKLIHSCSGCCCRNDSFTPFLAYLLTSLWKFSMISKWMIDTGCQKRKWNLTIFWSFFFFNHFLKILIIFFLRVWSLNSLVFLNMNLWPIEHKSLTFCSVSSLNLLY